MPHHLKTTTDQGGARLRRTVDAAAPRRTNSCRACSGTGQQPGARYGVFTCPHCAGTGEMLGFVLVKPITQTEPNGGAK